MKNILFLIFLVTITSCSEQSSKKIDLVCEGKYLDDSKKPTFSFHINKEQAKSVEYGYESPYFCKWFDSNVDCYMKGNDLNTFKLDRYSLNYHMSNSASNNGECKLIKKQF